MKDESKRRDYDRIYPFITRRRPSSHNTQTQCPHYTSTPQSGALSEAAQIAAIQKSKQARNARWQTKKNVIDSSIIELQRGIRQLNCEIKNLDSIRAAEAATEARKNSWGTWLLSPIYKKAEESEEEKARMDRERQERGIEKDMKERRLEWKKADLKTEENRLRREKEEVDVANLGDDKKIRVILDKIRVRENRERQEREKIEKERMVKIWRQQKEEQEKRRQEVADALRKQHAEKRAAEQKRQEEDFRRWEKIIGDEIKNRRERYTHFDFTEGSTRQAYALTCRHNGWWPKVQGYTACPKCYESWTYLLQCPGCKMKACPRCQAKIRPRRPHYAASRVVDLLHR